MSDRTTAGLTTCAVVAVAVALISPGPTTRAPASISPSIGHRHAGSPIGFLHSAEDQAPWSRQAAGGRAVAHHAGGKVIKTRAITAKAPSVQLHLVGTTAAEPTLGADPKGVLFFVGLEDTGSVLQAPVLKSTDKGRTWTEVSPHLGPQRVHVSTQDPMLYVDKRTGRVFTADLSLIVGCGSTISWSDDQGETWTTSQVCALSTDHQNVFTGPPAMSPTVGYPNVVYYCAIDGGALGGLGTYTSCAKSLDGGRTWVRTGEPPFVDGRNTDPGHFGVPGHCGGETAHGVVDSDGVVYLPRGWCGQPWLAISDDEGLTWRRVQVADNGMPMDPGGLQEHETGVAVDPSGNVYYVWTARDRLPYLAISDDEGETWSQPQMIGAPGITEAWGPAIDVGADGKIAITYIASRNAPGGEAPTGSGGGYNAATWNAYITVTTNALAPRPVYYTGQLNASSDPLIKGSCGVLRCQQEFDFLDVVIAPDGTPYSSLVDGCPPEPTAPCPLFGVGGVGRLVGGPSLL